MFYNFNAHRQKKLHGPDGSDALAKKIAAKIMVFQCCWADLMSRFTRKIPLKWFKALLLSAVLVATGFCLYLIFTNAAQPFTTQVKWLWQKQHYPDNKNTSKVWLYLDSLENAVRLDSILHPSVYRPLK